MIIPLLVKMLMIFTTIMAITAQFAFAQPELLNYEKNVLRSQIMPPNEFHLTSETDYLMNNYDVKFYKLELSVSNTSTEIIGNVMVNATVQTSPLDTFVIELIDTLVENTTYMVVDSLFINGINHSFTHDNDLIKVPLSQAFPINSDFTAQIYYHGNAEATETSGYMGVYNYTAYFTSITFSISEPFWAKVWWPCKQVLADKADSVHIFITTESNCKVGSNGLLQSITPLANNKVCYEWKSNYPIAYYLVFFSVGEYIENITYAVLAEPDDSVLVQSYLIQGCPYLSAQMVAIEKTKQLMNIFSDFFGVYPFKNEKYGYCLMPWSWGAMENQTMTTIGYQALDTTASSIGWYYIWYTAHELGHSWFGDNVTCASWQDVWIKEGFASYCEYLALQNLETQNSADVWMQDAHNIVKSQPNGSVYVPSTHLNNGDRILDFRLSYKKGAAIVHMIRFELQNDSLFLLVLKNFQNQFKDSVATGLDFKAVLESTSDIDFTDFFNQWYFGEGYPIYDIAWTQNNDTLLITSNQITSTSSTPLFKMLIEFKLYYTGGDTTIRAYQTANEQTFQITIPYTLTDISVDPNNWLLAQTSIHHTAVDDNLINQNVYSLSQNYPNPFNPVTTISYQLPKSAFVNLTIYNITGQLVKTMVSEYKNVGYHSVIWNASGVGSGLYFYRIEAGDYTETKKCLILK